MLESKKIELRRSEVRQQLATLGAKTDPTADELRSMETLSTEYNTLESRYRACLIGEDQERREAGKDLETRGDKQWADLIRRFELRQVANFLDTGDKIDGATAEIVTEMRARGAYQGVPVPLMALERRAGETIASGVPDPMRTMPIIDRLFPASVASRLGASLINIDSGAQEWPVVTSGITAAWADGELADVAAPAAFATTDRPLKPEQNFGVQMVISRKSLKQAAGIEEAVRRDMSSAIEAGLDRAIFLGTGANGQPLGVVAGQSTYAYGTTAVGADASWGALRNVISAFMAANAANGPGDVRILTHPQTFNFMDGEYVTGTAVSQWDLLTRQVPAANIALSSNTTVLTAGTPDTTTALLATSAGGVPPIFVGVWGGLDVVRDPYAGAAAGSLKLTALCTADLTISRPGQLHLLTALQVE
jgi:HK97 family phage major capsid protein